MNAQQMRETDPRQSCCTTWTSCTRSSSTCDFRMSTRQLENTSRVKQVRREIARVKTILRERELQAEEQ